MRGMHASCMHVIEELLALDGSAAYLSSLGISECVSPARPSSSASSSSSSAAVSSAYLGAGGCGIGPSSSSSSAEAAELRSQLAALTRRESALHAECDMLRKQAGRRSTEVRKLCERHAAEVSGLELQASARDLPACLHACMPARMQAGWRHVTSPREARAAAARR